LYPPPSAPCNVRVHGVRAVKVLGDHTLGGIARERVETTIDWALKESVEAKLSFREYGTRRISRRRQR
jgi:hypothetical protein